MRNPRLLAVAPLALALAASASAQFDGPAPLAWRWAQPTAAPPSGAPLVDGDTIFTAIGGRVIALDRATGNTKWRYPAVDPIDGAFRQAPILAAGTLVAAADNKIVYAVDPNTGQAKWTYTSPSPVLGQPVNVADKYVAYATSDNKLIALDAVTGAPVWKQPFNIFDGFQGQIASYGNGIVFFNGKNELLSLDVITQKPNYNRPTKFGTLPPGAVPVLMGETFYVASGPYLVAINAATGLSKWQYNTNLQLAFAPAPSAEGILVVSQNGEALVLDPQNNGRPIEAMKKGAVKLGSFPSVRPTVAGTKFVVPTSNGAVNLFDPKTGTLLWSFVVRPVGDVYDTSGSNNANNGRLGGGTPGQSQGRLVTSLAASGPAVLAGQTLLVPARDGSILAFDKELGVDLTPPTIKQLWPNPGDIVSGQPPLELIFRASDEAAGINESSIKVMIDGKPYEQKYTRDGYIRVAFSSISGSNTPLQDGRHAIVVELSDWLGNVSKTEYSIVIDNSLRPLPLPGSDQTGQQQGGGAGRGGDGG